MYKQLFFDDQRLFGRDNLTREYGKPKLVGIYKQAGFSTAYSTSYVFEKENEYYMLFYAFHIQTRRPCLLIAKSGNGIDFMPFDTSELSLANRLSENQICFLDGYEIANIICDDLAPQEQRYKMLLTRLNDKLHVDGEIRVSSDLIHWSTYKTNNWNNGSEPILGIDYDQNKNDYILSLRPTWGSRRVGITHTEDFENFTPYSLCLQQDSLDSPLTEIYGMPLICYHNIYIGFPLLYSGHKSSLSAKFDGGTIYPQLSYSWDGEHWQRSLRKNFLFNKKEFTKLVGFTPKMIWLSCIREYNGYIYIYCSATKLDHGNAFRQLEDNNIYIFKLRKDGFICLSAKDKGKLILREALLFDGELSFNLKAKNATVAIYESTGESNGSVNVLGFAQEIKGFTHSDCTPFSGDTTNWVPHFKGGKTDTLKGKTLVIEIKFDSGKIYSVNGNIEPLMNTEAANYRRYKKLPAHQTF